MNHEHKEQVCEHSRIEWCKICDITYCMNCAKEWKQQVYYWTYTPNTGDTWRVPMFTTFTSHNIIK